MKKIGLILLISCFSVALLLDVFVFGDSITKGLIGKQDIRHWDGVTSTFTRATSDGYTLTLNRLDWSGVDVLQVYGGGVNRTKATLTSALTAVGAVNKIRFFLSPGAWTIDDDITITSNITLYVPPGASLAVSATKTLTIEGPIEAGPYQIFSGAGTITISSVILEHDSWRDGTGNDILPSTDNSIDLGSSTQEFKDLYIDGEAYIDTLDLNGTEITATGAELNIMDGVTATTAELNIMDGVTATAADINNSLLGDGTHGRVLRIVRLKIENATDATEIKCTVENRWNGDAIAVTDNIGKNETVGDFNLSVGGNVLTILDTGLTGNCVGIISADIIYDASANPSTVDYLMDSNDIQLWFSDDAGGGNQDLTTLVDTGSIYIVICYITDA